MDLKLTVEDIVCKYTACIEMWSKTIFKENKRQPFRNTH